MMPHPKSRRTRTFRGHGAVACLIAVIAISAASPDARAQGANDAAAAESLFNEGKRLMGAGQYAAACPKFAESQRLDPGVGTMLWLGECYAKSGRLASAWAMFHEAEGLAAKQKDNRASVAREEARKLEPKLSKLVIDTSAAANIAGLEVRRDGVVLGKPVWGTPIPTDAGAHRITASAPGKKTWEGEVTVPMGGGSAVLKVPDLEAAPVVAAPPPTQPAPAQSPPPIEGPPSDEPSTTGNAQRIVGVTVAGLGLAGVAVGSYFGLRVRSKLDEASPHCNADNVCDQAGFDAREDALTSARVSDIAFVAGGVLLAGGVVLFLAAPKARRSASFGVAPTVGLNEAGVVARASWH
jgi:hypothetical protein